MEGGDASASAHMGTAPVTRHQFAASAHQPSNDINVVSHHHSLRAANDESSSQIILHGLGPGAMTHNTHTLQLITHHRTAANDESSGPW